MLDLIRRNPLAFILSAAVHVLVIGFMVVGVDWREKPQKIVTQVDVVKARVVDESRLQSEINKQRKLQQDKKDKEQQNLAALKKKQDAEKKRLADLEKQRQQREKAEQQKKLEAQKKQEVEKQRIAELEKKRKDEEKKAQAAEKKRRELEAQRVAEEKKRQEAEARRIAEEKQRREEEKLRKEAEQKRLADEKKRKAEQAAREKAAREKAEREARERELAEQLAAEAAARERSSAITAITQKIQRNWLRPISTADDLRCTVRVSLIPGGIIKPGSVAIIKSSGNGAFDRSVEQAIYKAEPLPVPAGPAFEQFRNIDFVFDPID